MSKDLDRLKEMKEMTLDLSKRIDGDDYFIGLISKLKTSMNLICKEEYKIADDDMLTLDKNLSALIEKLHSCNEDLINYASLISNLQIKYNDDMEPVSSRNIKNINNAINKFDINILLRYKDKNKKME